MKLVCPKILPEMSDDTIINHHVVWRHMKIPYLLNLLYGEFNVWCKTNHSSLYISILDIFRCVGTFELWVSLRIEFRMATAIWDLRRYPKLLLQVWFRKYWSWKFMDFLVSEIGRNPRPGRSLLLPQRARRTQTLRGRWSQPGLWYQDTSSKYSIVFCILKLYMLYKWTHLDYLCDNVFWKMKDRNKLEWKLPEAPVHSPQRCPSAPLLHERRNLTF